jgi:hypothetical protein
VRSGDWKLIEYFEDDRRELFHLADDPFERQDLSAAESSKAGEPGRMLSEWRESVAAQMPTARTPQPTGAGTLAPEASQRGAPRPGL